MAEKILSVAVAACNIEKCIGECLGSFIWPGIAEKTEVIVTDGGSSDRTGEIAERFARRYPDTIRVLRQESRGRGCAVNSGLEHARGRYFFTVGGGDWLDASGMKTLIRYLEATDVDMVCAPYGIFSMRTGREQIIPAAGNGIGLYRALPAENGLKGTRVGSYGAVFRRKLLTDNRIRFDTGLYADIEYLLYPLPYVRTVALLGKKVYICRAGGKGWDRGDTDPAAWEEEHRAVLSRLIGYFSEHMHMLQGQSVKRSLIAERIAGMAGEQLSGYLRQGDREKYRDRTASLIEELMRAPEDVRQAALRIDALRLLKMTRLTAYPLLAAVYRSQKRYCILRANAIR